MKGALGSQLFVAVLELAIYKTNVLNKTITFQSETVFIVSKYHCVVTHLPHTWMSSIKMCQQRIMSPLLCFTAKILC